MLHVLLLGASVVSVYERGQMPLAQTHTQTPEPYMVHKLIANRFKKERKKRNAGQKQKK